MSSWKLLLAGILVASFCAVKETVSFSAYRDNLLDLTYDFAEGFTMTWPGKDLWPYSREITTKNYTSGGSWYTGGNIRLTEHSGTHMDSPSHFGEGKWTVDQIPIEHLIVPASVIDIREKAAKNSTAVLSTDDIMTWLDENGDFPNMSVVLLLTGWGDRYGNRASYFGTESGNISLFRFPGFSVGAAQLLVGYEAATGHKIVGVGLDTPSLDYSLSTDFKSHQVFAQANMYGLENMANLEMLPPTGAELLILPMKIKEGSGAPCRILARLQASSAITVLTLNQPLLLFAALISQFLFVHFM